MLCTTLPQLEHAVVRLRPLVASDLGPWFEYLSLPQVHEHTSWDVHGPDELQRHVRGPGPSDAASPLRLAIATRIGDELVGTAGFHTVSPQNASAEIAYDLAPAHWHRGIATAACRALTAWAHTAAGITRVQATVLQSNLRSMSVLERCGFQREGLLRAYRKVRGTHGDFYMYAHLALPPGPASTLEDRA